jgi:hypothetical protein
MICAKRGNPFSNGNPQRLFPSLVLSEQQAIFHGKIGGFILLNLATVSQAGNRTGVFDAALAFW